MKITSIKSGGFDHTWDISTINEEYVLPNGVVSHNTSAQISNSTNGIEPVRSLVTEKVSKHGVLKQVVPEIAKLKNKYDMLWDQKSPLGYIKLTCVLQKYIDQAISTNTSYNPNHYEDNNISMKEMIEHLLFFYKHGGKCLYYFNTYDGVDIFDPDEPVNNNLEELPEDDDCESCKL